MVCRRSKLICKLLDGAVMPGLFVCFVSLLFICGCVKENDLYIKADELVGLWDEAAVNMYHYSSFVSDTGGRREYIVEMRPDTYEKDVSDGYYTDAETARQCAAQLARELCACFNGEDMAVMFRVYDGCGDLQYAYTCGAAGELEETEVQQVSDGR